MSSMLRVFIKKRIEGLVLQSQRHVHNIPVNTIPLIKPRYISPLLVSTTACASIFTIAAIVHEREKQTFWKRLRNRKDLPNWTKLRELIKDDQVFNREIWEARRKLLLEKKERILQSLNNTLERYQSLPIGVRNTISKSVQVVLSMTEAERTLSGLIALNILVFGAWRVRRLQPLMNRYFVHNPSNGRYMTLLTSAFSQRHPLHLVINIASLWMIGPLIYDKLGREQFIALYLSLGIGSNTVSHVTQLALSSYCPIVSTHGANVAIFGLVSGTAVMSSGSVFFKDYYSLSIDEITLFLASFGIVNILMGQYSLNPFGNLGGLALGFAYMKVGPDYIWPRMLQEVRDIKDYFNRKKGNGGGVDTSGVLMEIPQKIRLKILGKKATVPEEQ